MSLDRAGDQPRLCVGERWLSVPTDRQGDLQNRKLSAIELQLGATSNLGLPTYAALMERLITDCPLSLANYP